MSSVPKYKSIISLSPVVLFVVCLVLVEDLLYSFWKCMQFFFSLQDKAISNLNVYKHSSDRVCSGSTTLSSRTLLHQAVLQWRV